MLEISPVYCHIFNFLGEKQFYREAKNHVAPTITLLTLNFSPILPSSPLLYHTILQREYIWGEIIHESRIERKSEG